MRIEGRGGILSELSPRRALTPFAMRIRIGISHILELWPLIVLTHLVKFA